MDWGDLIDKYEKDSQSYHKFERIKQEAVEDSKASKTCLQVKEESKTDQPPKIEACTQIHWEGTGIRRCERRRIPRERTVTRCRVCNTCRTVKFLLYHTTDDQEKDNPGYRCKSCHCYYLLHHKDRQVSEEKKARSEKELPPQCEFCGAMYYHSWQIGSAVNTFICRICADFTASEKKKEHAKLQEVDPTKTKDQKCANCNALFSCCGTWYIDPSLDKDKYLCQPCYRYRVLFNDNRPKLLFAHTGCIVTPQHLERNEKYNDDRNAAGKIVPAEVDQTHSIATEQPKQLPPRCFKKKGARRTTRDIRCRDTLLKCKNCGAQNKHRVPSRTEMGHPEIRCVACYTYHKEHQRERPIDDMEKAKIEAEKPRECHECGCLSSLKWFRGIEKGTYECESCNERRRNGGVQFIGDLATMDECSVCHVSRSKDNFLGSWVPTKNGEDVLCGECFEPAVVRVIFIGWSNTIG